MDVALLRLLMMRLRGGVRLRVAQLTSLRGVLSLLALGGIVWVLVAAGETSPDVSLFAGPRPDPQTLRAHISTFMPLGLLGMTLATVALTTGRSFHFSPNEINFLFVGPFSRRDLILYKFVAYLAGATLSAALVTPFAQSQTGSALVAFVATLLTLVFIQLNSAVVGMAWQASEGSRFAPLRWPILAVLLAIVLGVAFYAWLLPDRGILDLLSDFRRSWIGTVILLPYIVFSELFLAQALFPHLAGWAAVAVLVNAALLQVAVVLDGRTSEHALVEDGRLSDRWERMKRGGSFWATERTEVRSISNAPTLGGLGPVTWRQAINAYRNSAKVFVVFLVVAACTGPVVSTADISSMDARAVALGYFFFAFIVPRTLVCDFRSDLSRMEIYKSLPIAPWRICVGQLVVQVLLASAIILVMIASVFFFAEGLIARDALILVALVVPLNLLLYAFENTMFLLFPAQIVPMGRADFEFLGRAVIEFVVKTLILSAALAMAGGVGLYVLFTFETSWALPALASWLTLVLLAVLATFVMQFAFRRFAVAETID